MIEGETVRNDALSLLCLESKMTSNCISCNHPHSGDFCSDRFCTCPSYIPDGMDKIAKIQRAIHGMRTTKEAVEVMLKDVPEFRNLSNKDFVFTFYHYYNGYLIPTRMRRELVDPETVRRCKQLLVAENPIYAPDEEVSIEKIYKEWGVMEFVTE